ncbi:hypothetical protein V3C99_009306, partial [Haemonchus contortus]
CICTERYRQPKVLPCQHTFCLQCLEMFAIISQSAKLICPICRAKHSIPSEGVQTFPDVSNCRDGLWSKYATVCTVQRLFGGVTDLCDLHIGYGPCRFKGNYEIRT